MPMIGRRFSPGMKRAAWGAMQSGDLPVPVMHLKFGENAGAVAKDSSPNGNDGTIYYASWAKGILGPGLDFDGVDDYVTVADSVELRLEGAHSGFAWAKLDSYVSVSNHVFRKYAALKGFMLRVQNTGALNVQIHNGGLVGDVTSSVVYTLGKWAHVGYTMDASKNILIYYNGLPVKSGSATAFPGASTGTVMGVAANSEGTERMDGILDEVRIYDVALTARQVKELYLGME